MILALAGQFKQLSHEPEKFRWLNGIRTHDLCDAGAVLSPTELWSHTVESRSICWAHVFPWKECHMEECYMQCGVWNQMKIWSSHLLDNLSNCLMNLKNSGDSTGFEPMTSAMPVQCSHQLSYEVTQWRAGQFVGLMFSRERNVIWKNVICSAYNILPHHTVGSTVITAIQLVEHRTDVRAGGRGFEPSAGSTLRVFK